VTVAVAVILVAAISVVVIGVAVVLSVVTPFLNKKFVMALFIPELPY